MTTPKNPEEIMAGLFYEDVGQCVDANLLQLEMDNISRETARIQILANVRTKFEVVLRSSMASLLLWASEQMPQKVNSVLVSPEHFFQRRVGYITGIDDCKAILTNEARKLTDV